MRNRFVNRGNGSVFNCGICGRRTRETDTGGTGLCFQCYEICGFDNMINDNGYQPGSQEYECTLSECDRLLTEAVKRGGNEQKIKGCATYIWTEKRP